MVKCGNIRYSAATYVSTVQDATTHLYCTARYGAALHGIMRYDIILFNIIRYGTVRYDAVWYGTAEPLSNYSRARSSAGHSHHAALLHSPFLSPFLELLSYPYSSSLLNVPLHLQIKLNKIKSNKIKSVLTTFLWSPQENQLLVHYPPYLILLLNFNFIVTTTLSHTVIMCLIWNLKIAPWYSYETFSYVAF